ncbi:alpha/beta fold hydrolase [Caedibacter taeniospiralis]|jgi:NTE family protein|uniref:alpha/beta fold hydrolase n=1 Tax=Caedibacter taeniospiralis TaxID=28907 RepID=UPI0037BF4634
MMLSITKRLFRTNRRLCVYHNELDPRRKTLFFIHGITGSAINWQAQFRHLSQAYNIVAYDLYGHGQSGCPKKAIECSMIQSVLDAQSIIEYFNLHNITIIAYGYSALISLLLCEKYPKLIQKQLLINPLSYEQLSEVPWYLHWPFSWGYRFFRLNKGQVKAQGNNSLNLPKLWVIRAYYQSLLNLPALNMSHSRLRMKTMVLPSVRYLPSKRERIDNFYKVFYRAKVKPLESGSPFPMRHSTTRVNHFLKQTIDEINIHAFRNLVFEGAGVRGIAYSGAITALESLGVLRNIHRFAGASAGAIYAIFLAVGFSAKEIEDIVSHLDYTLFMDASRNFISNSTRLLTDFGWYKGDFFVNHMAELIARKLPNGFLDFKTLTELTGKELYIVGTNLTKECAEVYSAKTTPDMQVVEALRIATCIPMLFKAVRRKEGREDHILVDGGLTWNCPLELFDDQKYLHNSLNGLYYDERIDSLFNAETLGFRLDPKEDPLKEMRKFSKDFHKIGHIFEFTREFMKFYSLASLKRHLEPHNWNRIVFVDTLDIMGTDFEITQEEINRLIEQGKSGVYQHFSWRMGENGVKFPQ